MGWAVLVGTAFLVFAVPFAVLARRASLAGESGSVAARAEHPGPDSSASEQAEPEQAEPKRSQPDESSPAPSEFDFAADKPNKNIMFVSLFGGVGLGILSAVGVILLLPAGKTIALLTAQLLMLVTLMGSMVLQFAQMQNRSRARPDERRARALRSLLVTTLTIAMVSATASALLTFYR